MTTRPRPPDRRSPLAERVAATVRQRRFPRALRIAPEGPPADIEALVAALTARARTGPDHASDDRGADGDLLDDRALAGLATGLWRARRRMLGSGTDEPRAEMRPVFRHLQSSWDTLAEAGITIQDHDGQPFESGLALEVLTFQPTPGLRREAVVETVRPSVYVRDRAVQLGQVIVGTPQSGGTPDEEGDRS